MMLQSNKNSVTSTYQNQIYSFNEKGWFNATQAASRFGKQVHEWLRLPDTEKYMTALQAKYGKIPYLRTKRGNNGGKYVLKSFAASHRAKQQTVGLPACNSPSIKLEEVKQ